MFALLCKIQNLAENDEPEGTRGFLWKTMYVLWYVEEQQHNFSIKSCKLNVASKVLKKV